jgi:hypothetical protein
MSILQDSPGEGYKLCKKKLHWYLPGRGCLQCAKQSSREWAKLNKEKTKQTACKWRKNNRQKATAATKNWQKNNRERVRQYDRQRYQQQAQAGVAWHQLNPKQHRKNGKTSYEKNKAREFARVASRRALKKQAVACWSNKEKIKKFYEEAQKLTIKTGEVHHVDHVYPLQSDWLCGLHVESNLQILTEKENQKKGNRTWPGQLLCQKKSVYAIFPKELTDLLNDQKT